MGEMRVFVRAIERGGFSAAAKDMGLTPSAVSKLVSRLETRLGVRLVNRTTRQLALTSQGQTYFESARRILEAVESLETEVAAANAEPRGLLRINAGVAFGLHQLTPALPAFCERYPKITVELSLTDRIIDFHSEPTDVAIRAAVLNDSTLVARHFADMKRVICASPAYIARRGTPRTPGELREHACITLSSDLRLSRWPFRAANGGIEHVDVTGPLRIDNADGMVQAAIAGAGIIRLGDLILGEPIRRGLLVPLLLDVHHVETVPLSAVFAPGTQRVPKIRVFVDFLVERFRSAPWCCDEEMAA